MVVQAVASLLADAVDTGTEVANERVVTIDEYWLNLAISFFLPVLVALITKRFADSAVKAVALILLSVVTGWLTSLQATGGAFEIKSALTSVLISFAMAVTTHFGLWAPARVTGKNGAVQVAVPGGVGAERTQP